MRPALYGSYHHITVAGKEDAPCDHVYDVVGGLCENNDKFAIDRALPEIEDGDVLVIHDTGAHGHSMGYNYNGKLRSAELLLRENGQREGSFVAPRRRPTTSRRCMVATSCWTVPLMTRGNSKGNKRCPTGESQREAARCFEGPRRAAKRTSMREGKRIRG